MSDLSFQQIIDTIARPYTDVPAFLREQEILPPAAEVQGTPFVVAERVVDKLQEAILRIDPTAPHRVVGSTVVDVWAAHAYVFTEGSPPFIRL